MSWCSLRFACHFGCYTLAKLFWKVDNTAEVETIESVTQPGLLYSELTNYAEPQSENQLGTLLESMAEQAKALMLAEAVTQVDESARTMEEGAAAVSGSTGHIFKKFAVETGVNGTPVATPRVDAHEQTLIEDRD